MKEDYVYITYLYVGDEEEGFRKMDRIFRNREDAKRYKRESIELDLIIVPERIY